MSRNASPSSRKIRQKPVSKTARKTDRRVLHTRDALGDALVVLMHEKPFASITVQHVLDRAGVGRSTFYTHYRDKDDLFLSDAEEFFEGMSTLLERRKDTSNRVAPVREFFAHVAEMRTFHAALVASGKIHDLWELGRGHFTRAIDQRIAVHPHGRRIAPDKRTAFAHALAGALFSLLSWWIARGTPAPPEQMDDLYHHMVWSGLSLPARAGQPVRSGAHREHP